MNLLLNLPPLLALATVAVGAVRDGVTTSTGHDFVHVHNLDNWRIRSAYGQEKKKYANVTSQCECSAICGSLSSCLGFYFTPPSTPPKSTDGCYFSYCRANNTDGEIFASGPDSERYVRWPFVEEADWEKYWLNDVATAELQRDAEYEIEFYCLRNAAKNGGLKLLQRTATEGTVRLQNSSEVPDEPSTTILDLGYIFDTSYSLTNKPYGCMDTNCLQKILRSSMTGLPALARLGSSPKYFEWIGLIGSQKGCCGSTLATNVPVTSRLVPFSGSDAKAKAVAESEDVETVTMFLWQ